MQITKTTTTKTKRRLALFVALIMLLSLWVALPQRASADTDAGTQLTYTVDADNNATITGYTGSDKTTKQSINIPATVNGTIPVTSVAANALTGLPALTTITTDNPNYSAENGVLFNKDKTIIVRYPAAKISAYTIPDGVTKIADRAFEECRAVTSIAIPASLTSIAYHGIYNCASLSAITVAAENQNYSVLDGVLFTKDMKTIVSYPAAKAGETYSIPGGVTSIGIGAFAGSSLGEVTMPAGVTSIGIQAFFNSQITSIDIPDSVTEIGNSAFQDCKKLASIKLPNGLTVISDGLLRNCDSLTTVKLPDSVTSIRTLAFYSCDNLVSVNIPEGVTSIGGDAFQYCPKLTSLWIPESVTDLGATALLANSPALTSVTILGVNPTIASNAFYNCKTDLKVWIYNSATSVKTAVASYTPGITVIMIEAPVISETKLELDATDSSKDTAHLSVTGYLPAAQTETDPARGNHTPTITWSSSNIAAATVNPSTGTVTAVAPGTALITATADAHGGEKTASIPVSVASSGTTYALTVTNGEFVGNGPFVKDAKVTIVADEPKVVGQVFDKWEITSSTGGSIADPTSPTTVFTMPDAAATVRATYKNVHALTVANGTGSGSYASGKSVAISADVAPSGQVFDKWTTSNGGSFANDTSADTTFTMPDNPVTITATYKDETVTPPPATTAYTVTVVSGSDGANGKYEAGVTVNITANAPASGKVFDTWTSNDGVTFANANNAQTSFVMPAKDVTVTATYKDEPVDPPVNPPVDPPVVDDGWVHEDGVWKYFVDGVAVTGWVYDDTWYYLNADGEMQTGWVYDGGTWYYLAGNGAMKTGWVKVGGNWYYLAGNGAMVASKWLKDTDGSWYYLSGNGKMLTGKQKVGGKVYSFKTNGVWIG
jgi:hypothetical protein